MIDSNKEQYFKSKDFKALFDKYEKSVQGEPFYFDPEELTDIAEYYLFYDNDEKATLIIDRAIRTFPDAIDPLLFRSRYALLRENNVEKAKYYAEKIKDTSDYEFIYLKAEILIYENALFEADEYLHKVLRSLNPQEKADYLYDVANLFIDYEVFDLAKKWINYSDDKTGKDYLETTAHIHLLEQNYSKAEELYAQLTDREPYSTVFWAQLAIAQYLNGKIQEAIQSSEFALAIDPISEDALLTKANCLLALEKLPEALIFFNRYLQQRPKEGQIEAAVANIYVRMNAPQKALEHYNDAIKHANGNQQLTTDIIRQKALLLMSLGQTEEAFRIIDECISMTGYDATYLYVTKGNLFMIAGQIDKSIHQYEKAISISADKPSTYYFIGTTCYDTGAYDIAYDFLKHITVDLQDNATDGWGYYAACCAHLRRDTEFLDALRIGCKNNPEEIYFVFSDILSPNIQPEDLYEFITNKLTK